MECGRNARIIDREKQIIMDKKIIQQFGTDILCYRIRTARQKIRMQHEDLDKRLMRLDREVEALYEQKRNLGWEPLIPPVQKGWKRCFVLREDVAQGKYAEFFEGILKKINTYEYSHRRDFLLKRRKRGRKIYVPKPQKLLSPDSWHFKRLGFAEAEKQFFHPEYEFYKGNMSWKLRYVFNEPWRFVLKVSPNIIDKVRIRDHELEAKIRILSNYFERNDLNGRCAKLVRGRSYHWKDYEERLREVDPLKYKPITRILDELGWNDIKT